ncbi:MAG: ROK family protein [Bdellovibrionales bacterium]|nr:ROK family protein [Bdellovibrionales bacterium]
MAAASSTVLAIDVGGTKTAAAAVNAEGKILKRAQVQTTLADGPDSFIENICSVASSILDGHDCSSIGIASAGPLDPINGLLINPTNLKSEDGKPWGNISIVEPIQRELQKPVILENDAACAVLAEDWIGAGQHKQSTLVMTLGTGVGIGVISNNKLVRLRNSFHPEASHFSLNFTDKLAKCGCGNYGCVEAYLGGKNFVSYCNKRWGIQAKDGLELKALAQNNDPKALEAFNFYSEAMAQALTAYAVLFAPEVVVFSGGFSHNFEFFYDKTNSLLKDLLKDRREGLDFLPEICVSEMQEDAGLLGAARVALQAPERF